MSSVQDFLIQLIIFTVIIVCVFIVLCFCLFHTILPGLQNCIFEIIKSIICLPCTIYNCFNKKDIVNSSLEDDLIETKKINLSKKKKNKRKPESDDDYIPVRNDEYIEFMIEKN
jgi:hypothetical protein